MSYDPLSDYINEKAISTLENRNASEVTDLRSHEVSSGLDWDLDHGTPPSLHLQWGLISRDIPCVEL